MGRVVAIGGFSSKTGIRLDMHAIQMTGKEHPNMLYLATAQMDAAASVERGIQRFEAVGCHVKPLCLVTKSYTEEELDLLLAWADIIYVGGGDTVSMLRVWREHGLDTRLKKIYETDAAVLAGISAGAICWFSAGHSDSESFHQKDGWNFCWAENALDLFHAVYCPHYNDRGRDSFDEMLREKDMVGLAVENDAAFVECGAERYFIKCTPTARAFALKYTNGILEKTELDAKEV